MQVHMTGRHVELTEALKRYVEEKVRKLQRYLPDPMEADAVLTVEKHRHRAEILIRAGRHLIQAEEETNEMYAAVDRVVDKLERQIKKYRGKLINHHKAAGGKGRAAEKSLVPPEEPVAEPVPRISRAKRFAMKPMTPEEAVMQMDLLHKDFFVFANSLQDGAINVIYRRRDGNVGLIEPL